MLRVRWMQIDLHVDVLPPFAVHLVIGGEEDVHPRDGYVADVMEVTASAFSPRATQFTRSHSYLIRIGADDRFESRRVARRETRIDVAGGGQCDLTWQTLFA